VENADGSFTKFYQILHGGRLTAVEATEILPEFFPITFKLSANDYKNDPKISTSLIRIFPLTSLIYNQTMPKCNFLQ